MKAYSSVSGGVIFVPDTIEKRTKSSTKYKDLVDEQKHSEKPAKIFGRRRTAKTANKVAA